MAKIELQPDFKNFLRLLNSHMADIRIWKIWNICHNMPFNADCLLRCAPKASG
jgi:hypothetical protein